VLGRARSGHGMVPATALATRSLGRSRFWVRSSCGYSRMTRRRVDTKDPIPAVKTLLNKAESRGRLRNGGSRRTSRVPDRHRPWVEGADVHLTAARLEAVTPSACPRRQCRSGTPRDRVWPGRSALAIGNIGDNSWPGTMRVVVRIAHVVGGLVLLVLALVALTSGPAWLGVLAVAFLVGAAAGLVLAKRGATAKWS